MLQRVAIQIQHQDFCNPNSKLWPPEDAIEIITSGSGVSCKDVCMEKRKYVHYDLLE